ncbi:Phosphatidylinositol 3,5-bisphosphate-binding protein [Lobaria immixta]|nr:Phosphatidylinositol 3,5-bisphosphate-binding protein [Lobaria immixta]
MLGRANYIALVGGGRQPKFPQNKVIIWDDAKQKEVITLEFRSQVNRVNLSRSRIIVALHNSVHMYTFSSPPEKISVFETADNPLGLCCLGSKVVAFPGRTPGQVQMVEIGTGNVSIIPAHSSPLRAMDLSPDGEILATASETGTLVRIFSTSNCARMGELRRGVDHAVIFSIAISPNSSLLAVTSDKATLHIFDLPHSLQNARNDPTSNLRSHHYSSSLSTAGSGDDGNNQKWGILGRIPLLPRVFSDVYSFTSMHFEVDDDPQTALGIGGAIPIPGIPGGKARKGIIGWTNDTTILVIGAGRDGRWEKFVMGDGGESGKRNCVRQGWKRYLGG